MKDCVFKGFGKVIGVNDDAGGDIKNIKIEEPDDWDHKYGAFKGKFILGAFFTTPESAINPFKSRGRLKVDGISVIPKGGFLESNAVQIPIYEELIGNFQLFKSVDLDNVQLAIHLLEKNSGYPVSPDRAFPKSISISKLWSAKLRMKNWDLYVIKHKWDPNGIYDEFKEIYPSGSQFEVDKPNSINSIEINQ